MSRKSPLPQLILCNIKGFFREPEAIFWTYGFPLLMIVGLGIAFDSAGETRITVDAVENPRLQEKIRILEENSKFDLSVFDHQTAIRRLTMNKTQIVISLDEAGQIEYLYDPTNPDSRSARNAIDDFLQESAGRTNPLTVKDQPVTAPGSRYVDFLVPGLIGMNLMGGGMWGVGFVIVDFRIKKLLKRLLATPMKKSHFLASMLGTRILFFIPEALVLLVAAHWIFGVPIQGGIVSIIFVALMGALTFGGLGLLAASRAQRIESISGIMNAVMLPMWLCSGIFFSSERFPNVMQPFIQALPLTQLINALRAVILEGQSAGDQILPMVILAAWGGTGFVLALKWFRWN